MTKKELINQIRFKVEKQFESITESIVQGNIDKLTLGTCGIYLNSILEHLTSLECLIEKGFIESAGSVGTSLWERSITLQYMLINPAELIKQYSLHNKVKKTPWPVRKMVNSIIDSENLPATRNPEIEKELLYIQYTYFCAIKHGNPYTISYLNRLEKNNNNSKAIGVIPNLCDEDEDLKNWLLLISSTTAFDALLKFSKLFCTQERFADLTFLNKEITRTIIDQIDLKVPQIILTSAEEFKEDFWKYLEELNKNVS